MGKSRVQLPHEAGIFIVLQELRLLVLDGTTYKPIDLKVGDLRRLAWTPSEPVLLS